MLSLIVIICLLFYDCRLEAEQKKFYGDDLKDGEVYDESEEDLSDSDQITEIIQEELKKLKDIQISRTSNTSNISSDPAQDKILNINVTKNEQSHFSTSYIQEKLKESCSLEPREMSKDTNRKERRISFAEPCVIEVESDTEKEISISQEACSAVKQDNKYNDSSEDEDNTIRIKFSHSSHIPDIFESDNMKIQSPVDIYKMFSAPKSILKRSPNDIILNQVVPPLNADSNTDTEDEDEYITHSAYNSVSKNNNLIILFLHR